LLDGLGLSVGLHDALIDREGRLRGEATTRPVVVLGSLTSDAGAVGLGAAPRLAIVVCEALAQLALLAVAGADVGGTGTLLVDRAGVKELVGEAWEKLALVLAALLATAVTLPAGVGELARLAGEAGLTVSGELLAWEARQTVTRGIGGIAQEAWWAVDVARRELAREARLAAGEARLAVSWREGLLAGEAGLTISGERLSRERLPREWLSGNRLPRERLLAGEARLAVSGGERLSGLLGESGLLAREAGLTVARGELLVGRPVRVVRLVRRPVGIVGVLIRRPVAVLLAAITEATSALAVLELGAGPRADATKVAVEGAALCLAVAAGSTGAVDELGAAAVADVLLAVGVRLDLCQDRCRDLRDGVRGGSLEIGGGRTYRKRR
jgi:hypothetical protein